MALMEVNLPTDSNMNKLPTHNQQGFTVVELTVTIIVAAMFATMFYQLFVTIVQVGSTVRRDAGASDIAYSYLRRYQKSSDISPAPTCASNTPAKVVIPSTNENDPSVGDYTIVVNAYAPWPICQTNSDIVKIESVVTYQNDGTKKVTHATYIN